MEVSDNQFLTFQKYYVCRKAAFGTEITLLPYLTVKLVTNADL